MAQGRSIYGEILKNFLNSFKRSHFKSNLVGRDYMGTEYFEAALTPGRKRPKRWFTPIEDDFQQEIPPEWEAWLRYRRKQPPTEEEIQINLAKMKQVVEKARKLEQKRTVPADEIKTFEKPSFPKYDDYETELPSKGNRKP